MPSSGCLPLCACLFMRACVCVRVCVLWVRFAAGNSIKPPLFRRAKLRLSANINSVVFWLLRGSTKKNMHGSVRVDLEPWAWLGAKCKLQSAAHRTLLIQLNPHPAANWLANKAWPAKACGRHCWCNPAGHASIPALALAPTKRLNFCLLANTAEESKSWYKY